MACQRPRHEHQGARPCTGGAPGWDAGLVVAARQQDLRRGAALKTTHDMVAAAGDRPRAGYRAAVEAVDPAHRAIWLLRRSAPRTSMSGGGRHDAPPLLRR